MQSRRHKREAHATIVGYSEKTASIRLGIPPGFSPMLTVTESDDALEPGSMVNCLPAAAYKVAGAS